jgi:hypothetical protein
MATVKLSVFARALSGKVGNVVFANTKEGTVMRERETPRNPNTQAQQSVRAAFRRVTQQWRSLTTAQAGAWNAWAARWRQEQPTTDEVFNLTGFNWFVKLGAKFLAVNPSASAAPVIPPAAAYPGDSITVSTVGGTGQVTFTASGPNGANSTTELMVQRVTGPNSRASRGGFRIRAYNTFATGSLSANVTLPEGYYATAYQFVNRVTGQQGPFVQLGVVYVTPVALAERTRKAA